MGKKKGGKGKGKKEKSEDGLPPPPNLDNYREGAREAFLTFKVQGKEDSILQCEEEAEEFKDKNYRQKEKNYDLKTVQMGHRKTLLQQALQYEGEVAGREEVTHEMVEEALWEKLQLSRDTEAELQELEEVIVCVGRQLEMERKDLEEWQKYKNSTAQTEEEHMKHMRDQMREMKDKEEELERYHESRLSVAKQEIDAKWQRRMQREKEAVSERLLNSLDKDGQAEMADNVWLKREIGVVRETISELRGEVDQLELRNLCLLEDMQREQLQELEMSVGLLQASTGHTRISSHATAAESDNADPSLPSLVDVSKTSSTRGTAGRLGQMERQLLNVEGHVAHLVSPPDSTHLPPLAQQRSCHSALPPRHSWSITTDMLNSIA